MPTERHVILRHAFIPPDNTRLAHLCGSLDEHLRSIAAAFDVSISRRNESFRVEGGKAQAERAVVLLQSLYDRARRPIGAEQLQLAIVEAQAALRPVPEHNASSTSGDEPVVRGVPRPGNLPSHHHQLMPQHRDLDIPGVRRWAEANQSEDPPDDHERQRLNHHDPQPAGDRPRWSAPGH